MKHTTRPLALAALATLAAAIPAQMGKRWLDRYNGNEFTKAKPAVGSKAPDLQLWDIDGRPRSLHLERGTRIVLIGGAYT